MTTDGRTALMSDLSSARTKAPHNFGQEQRDHTLVLMRQTNTLRASHAGSESSNHTTADTETEAAAAVPYLEVKSCSGLWYSSVVLPTSDEALPSLRKESTVHSKQSTSESSAGCYPGHREFLAGTVLCVLLASRGTG